MLRHGLPDILRGLDLECRSYEYPGSTLTYVATNVTFALRLSIIERSQCGWHSRAVSAMFCAVGRKSATAYQEYAVCRHFAAGAVTGAVLKHR